MQGNPPHEDRDKGCGGSIILVLSGRDLKCLCLTICSPGGRRHREASGKSPIRENWSQETTEAGGETSTKSPARGKREGWGAVPENEKGPCHPCPLWQTCPSRLFACWAGACCLPGFFYYSLGLRPGPDVACPGLFGRWASSSWGWGRAFLFQAEEAEREERKRLESQREAEWKKEEERLRLEEKQKVRQTTDRNF